MKFTEILDDHTLWDDFEKTVPRAVLGSGDPNFLYGVATSTFQDSGAFHCPNSQWSVWEKTHVEEGNHSGRSVNLFEIYEKKPEIVIDRLKKLGVNTYRFSVEWSHIEPKQGQFIREKLEVYRSFCQKLREANIEPMVTLHHFSEPNWFHEMGSFEHEENIAHYTNFSSLVFRALTEEFQGRPLVGYFCTINEPGVEAYNRYLLGDFSPGYRFRFKRGARFLLGCLKAHALLYEKLSGKEGVKIGITYQHLRFHTKNPLVKPVVNFFNKYFIAILRFFKEGIFDCSYFPLGRVYYRAERKPQTDFIGLQFYGRVFIGLTTINPGRREMTQMLGLPEDPEGIYEAIVNTFDAFQKPIFVTENGISTRCDTQRARHASRALVAAEYARQKIGPENFLGYLLWSLCDNFEWSKGWNQHFGAYPLTQEREISKEFKPGVLPYVQMVNSWKASFQK
ncbi:MAG: family 1 glycosylhydrolase [Simkaniaceae bacterium]|nr:family 1 glycosylhydrolase [Simkaniaceae bacterium]